MADIEIRTIGQTGFGAISSWVNEQISAAVPTTVASLSDAKQYAKKTDLPTTVAGMSDASDYLKKTDIIVHEYTAAEITQMLAGSGQ